MRKKLLALICAATMLMGMSTVAMADEATPSYSVTINVGNGNQNAHTYAAYQVLKGEFSDGKFVNAEWGDNLSAKTVTVDTNTTLDTVEKVVKYLDNEGFDSEKAKAFATAAGNAVSGDAKATATSEKGASVTLSGLTPGYYVIKDTTDTSADDYLDTLSRYILVAVSENTSVTAKNDTVSIEKKVEDLNDSEAKPDNGTLKDFADWDLGDKVPYQYKVTIPTDIDNYVNEYVFTFDDAMDKGLTFNKDVKVKIGDADYADFTLTEGDDSVTTDKVETFVIKTADLRKKGFAGKQMVVTYSATINEEALMASPIPNEVLLRFSNNPNGEGEGKTPWDKVVVFTYEVEVNKVDGDKNPLAGAGFTLYKVLESKYQAMTDDEIKTALKNDGLKIVTLDAEYKPATTGSKFIEVATMDATEKDGKYTSDFQRVDDGKYVLVETKTPAGYNTAKPVEFTIDATESMEAVTIDIKGVTEGAEVNKTTTGAQTTIVNNTGAVLPSTGGIGTTIFYIIGCILVVGGGAMLFVRKKMSKEEA